MQVALDGRLKIVVVAMRRTGENSTKRLFASETACSAATQKRLTITFGDDLLLREFT